MNGNGRRWLRAGGFSAVEVIVLIAVVALLTGIAVPLVSGHYQHGRHDRARRDVQRIGEAVARFYRDVGTWPARRAGVDGELFVLCSGAELPATNPFARPHQLTNWLLDGRHGDLLAHHLLENAPGGSVVGAYGSAERDPRTMRWRGPYMPSDAPLDPWGRPYLVTVISGTSDDKDLYQRLFVLSAGPDGVLDLSARLDATTNVTGDDIGMILSQRR